MAKICFVTTTSVTLRTFIVETAVMLHKKEGFDITFICDKDEEFSKNLPEFIQYIPVSMKRGIDFSGLKTVYKLIRVFKQNQYDIIQYSTPNAAFYASIAAKIAKVPVRLYGQWGIRYVGFQGLKRKIFKTVEKMTCLCSTDIRSVSFKNMEFGISESLYKKDKVKVLGKGGTIGVDIAQYDINNSSYYSKLIRDRYELNGAFVYGFVGRFSRDKGCNELLQAFKKLSQKFNVKLMCIGDCEVNNEINKSLFNWARNSKQVVFTGNVENKELKKYYAAMDCYVHPSHREGFGMVLQEAAAMGCPILTTRIPGASEVMIEGESCLLAEPGNIDSLYQMMEKIYLQADMAVKLGLAARKRVEKYYNRPIMLENQRKDYRELKASRNIYE